MLPSFLATQKTDVTRNIFAQQNLNRNHQRYNIEHRITQNELWFNAVSEITRVLKGYCYNAYIMTFLIVYYN